MSTEDLDAAAVNDHAAGAATSSNVGRPPIPQVSVTGQQYIMADNIVIDCSGCSSGQRRPGQINPNSVASGPTVNGPGRDDVAAKQDELTAALGGAVSGRRLLSLLNPGESAARAFGAEELTLLREIKAAWDPTGLFVTDRLMAE
jgi:FAD/FMN-containing dehydrogenase